MQSDDNFKRSFAEASRLQEQEAKLAPLRVKTASVIITAHKICVAWPERMKNCEVFEYSDVVEELSDLAREYILNRQEIESIIAEQGLDWTMGIWWQQTDAKLMDLANQYDQELAFNLASGSI